MTPHLNPLMGKAPAFLGSHGLYGAAVENAIDAFGRLSLKVRPQGTLWQESNASQTGNKAKTTSYPAQKLN